MSQRNADAEENGAADNRAEDFAGHSRHGRPPKFDV